MWQLTEHGPTHIQHLPHWVHKVWQWVLHTTFGSAIWRKPSNAAHVVQVNYDTHAPRRSHWQVNIFATSNMNWSDPTTPTHGRPCWHNVGATYLSCKCQWRMKSFGATICGHIPSTNIGGPTCGMGQECIDKRSTYVFFSTQTKHVSCFGVCIAQPNILCGSFSHKCWLQVT